MPGILNVNSASVLLATMSNAPIWSFLIVGAEDVREGRVDLDWLIELISSLIKIYYVLHILLQNCRMTYPQQTGLKEFLQLPPA